MKRLPKIAPALSLLIMLLAACNMPGQSTEPDVDIIATQVAIRLTEAVTEQNSQPAENVQPGVTPTQSQPIIEESTSTPTLSEPTQTTTQTPTNTATITETPTPTENLDDPAIRYGQPTSINAFDAASSWNFSDEQSSFTVTNGALVIKSFSATPYWHSWRVGQPKFQNGYIEALIRFDNCQPEDRFGLAFRSPDYIQFYYFGITCAGEWGFSIMDSSYNVTNLKSFEFSDAFDLAPDAANRIGVLLQGSQFTFYVNGEEIGQFSHSALSASGSTGFVITNGGNTGFTVSVEYLKYWALP